MGMAAHWSVDDLQLLRAEYMEIAMKPECTGERFNHWYWMVEKVDELIRMRLTGA